MTPTDGELIQKIRINQLNAFDQLYFRYKDASFRFAFYLTQNRDEADDIFQESWLKVVKFIYRPGDIRDFKSWLFTIIANAHRDELRKKKVRRLFLPIRFDDTASDDFPETHKQYNHQKIENPSMKIEFSLALKSAIQKLPENQKRVFLLKEIEGFKHSEISKILKMPVGTVKSLLHRAVKKLQQNLSEFQNE